MNKNFMNFNDVLWIITAVICCFYDHPVITCIVIATTIIYAVDLVIKFRAMKCEVGPFIKAYWVDILFLIPVCKIFRGFRIIKVGRLFKALDVSLDLTEIITRIYNALKKTRK